MQRRARIRPGRRRDRAKNGRANAKPEQQHRRRAQDQQQDVANLQDLAIAIDGFAQEIHRRPMDDAIAAAIEQVDDQRPGGGNRAGHGKHPESWKK